MIQLLKSIYLPRQRVHKRALYPYSLCFEAKYNCEINMGFAICSSLKHDNGPTRRDCGRAQRPRGRNLEAARRRQGRLHHLPGHRRPCLGHTEPDRGGARPGLIHLL